VPSSFKNMSLFIGVLLGVLGGAPAPPSCWSKSEIFRLSEILRRRSEIFIGLTYLYKTHFFAKMFYFTNYEVLIAISNIIKGVINDEKIDTISEFHNLDVQMLLSEANILPRCMQCRRGLAMRILSVRLSNACIVPKRKKDLSRFLHHTKDHSLVFQYEEWLVGSEPFYLKFWVNRLPLERNRLFSTDIRF